MVSDSINDYILFFVDTCIYIVHCPTTVPDIVDIKYIYTYFLIHIPLYYIQGVPKGTDTFQSLIIEKLDNLRKFFSYH